MSITLTDLFCGAGGSGLGAAAAGVQLTITKREQVAQLGNGVTPPAGEWLLTAVVDSLEGTHPPARPAAA